jgi:molybdenum cofactor biosynthesis enzyme MoaA
VKKIWTKNRNRNNPDFANINLLGKCNAYCYFCLGKDICDFENRMDTLVHWTDWKDFEKFLTICNKANIKKLYITGQNTDALLYKYLADLIEYLQDSKGFNVGLRTNGRAALKMIDIINSCTLETGYSIHSLNKDIIKKIMNWNSVPKWDNILSLTSRSRISMVYTRHQSIKDLLDICCLAKEHPVQHIQIRRVSSETRHTDLEEDVIAFEQMYNYIKLHYPLVGYFYGAQQHLINGVVCTFWRTIKTSINSFNYFTDGTISKEYFIIEGYLKNKKQLDK